MNERYYTYEGAVNENEGETFFKALFKEKMISYELKEEIKKSSF